MQRGGLPSSLAATLQARVIVSIPSHKPIISGKQCASCGHPLVRFLMTTGYAIYLHCELCGHEWNEPERRKVPRFQGSPAPGSGGSNPEG